MTKLCTGCKQELPLDRFYVSYRKGDKEYLMTRCKRCTNEAIANRKRNKRGAA